EIIRALDGVTLDIERGGFIAVVGRSGSGKTTMLDLLGLLLKPTAGKLFIDDVDTAQLGDRQRAQMRARKVGFVFQEYNLLSGLNVLENVMMPLRYVKNGKDGKQHAIELIDRVGLSDRLKHRPAELSGGQAQRVAIARSMVNRPSIILLDDIARRAEELGFSTLGTIGRALYPTYEELVTLGAAAAVTQRIGLMTDILLAATREPVLLAKQAATLDQISGGRFILGIGAGGREDDFTVSGRGFHDRGKRLDGDLELMHKAWRGEPLPGTTHPVTPLPTNGHSVPIAFGGFAEAVIRRIVKYGVGYTLGGGTPEALAKQVTRVTEAWKEAGREGKPRFWA